MPTATLKVTPELLTEIHKDFKAGEELRPFRIAKNGLPEDSKVIDMNISANSCAINIVLESKEFIGGEELPPVKFNRVFGALRDVQYERTRQDKKWGGPAYDDKHVPADWCDWIIAYATCAKTMASFDFPEKYRKLMIQVAALAVAAVQSHDRLMPYERNANKIPNTQNNLLHHPNHRNYL